MHCWAFDISQTWSWIKEGVDLVGKLGTLLVAIAVFKMNHGQNVRSNALSLRATDVEDQKFRLALLDRRVAVLDRIREILNNHRLANGFPPQMVASLAAVVRDAELVFEKDQSTELLVLREILARREILWRRYEAQGDEATADRDEAMEELIDAEDLLNKQIESVLESLVEATKISTVPPITRSSHSEP